VEVFNVGKRWNLPWLEVAVVDITESLPDETVWKTHFNIENHPSSLELPVPVSASDYRSLNYARPKAYKKSQWGRGKSPHESSNLESPCHYYITVKTGDKFGAGTKGNVRITLIGKNHRSNPLELNHPTEKSDKERNSENHYVVTDEDVGEVTQVKIELDKVLMVSDEWQLEFVEVTSSSTGTTYHFPCKQWVKPPGIALDQGSPY